MNVPMSALLKTRSVQVNESDDFFELLTDEEIEQNILLAHLLIGDWQQAHQAVKEMMLLLPGTLRALKTNRKPNPRKQPKRPRPSYRPLIDVPSVSRSLLLASVEEFQIRNEKNSVPRDEHYGLQCLVQKLVAISLTHSSFWAAVIMTQVLADYTAEQTISMYAEVAQKRASKKFADEVSTVKGAVISQLVARFSSLQLRKVGNAFRLTSIPNTHQHSEMLFELLSLILPPMPENSTGPQSGKVDESIEERKRMNIFFNLKTLNVLSGPHDGPSFTERLVLPIIPELLRKEDPDHDPTDNPPKGGRRLLGDRSKCEVAKIKREVALTSGRRQKLRPRSLSIVVDGSTMGSIDRFRRSASFKLAAHSNLIKVEAAYDNLRVAPLAAYLLTYGGSKAEQWTFKVPGLGRIECELTYKSHGKVAAKFSLQQSRTASTDQEDRWNRLQMRTKPLTVSAIGERVAAKSAVLNIAASRRFPLTLHVPKHIEKGTDVCAAFDFDQRKPPHRADEGDPYPYPAAMSCNQGIGAAWLAIIPTETRLCVIPKLEITLFGLFPLMDDVRLAQHPENCHTSAIDTESLSGVNTVFLKHVAENYADYE